MTRTLCVHGVQDLAPAALPGFRVLAHADSPHELLTGVGAAQPSAIIFDLDRDDAEAALLALREHSPDLPIIGVTSRNDARFIIDAHRHGCAQITTRPLDTADLLAALQRALAGQEAPPPQGRLYVTLSTQGGAGSTTLATHLALELAEQSAQPTALFDLDLEFGGVAHAFDVHCDYNVANLAAESELDDSLFRNASIPVGDHLRVFARPDGIDDALSVEETGVANMLDHARNLYSHLVVDLSPHLTPIAGLAIERAHKLLLVTQLTVRSVNNARRLLDILWREGIPDERIELVVNRLRKGASSITVSMAEDQLGREALALIPNDYQAARTATDSGRPLSADHPIRAAIRDLTSRLLDRPLAPPPPKRWLAKLGFGR